MEPQSSDIGDLPQCTVTPLEKRSAHGNIRILVDARKLGDGGIGVYTENLICGLLEQPGTQVSLIGTHEKASRYDWYSEVNVVEDRSRPYSLDEMFRLGRRIRQEQYDVFHVPHFTLPFGLHIPTVITLHDLIHVNHPERAYYPYIAKPLIRSALKRATRVISVSRSTFSDIEKFGGALEGKVRVIPNALDPCFVAATRAIECRQSLRKPYLIAVCSMLKPHKGVVDLLNAFEQVMDHLKVIPHSDPLYKRFADLKLVLVGHGTERMAESPNFLKLVDSVKNVHIHGAVTKFELAQLYAGAEALVVPSKAEGFCLPVIEAQAVGIPVIARPVPAIQELMGVSDFICEDFSVPALAAGILRFLQASTMGSSNPSCQISKASHALKFSRGHIAKTVLDVYRDAISSFSGSPFSGGSFPGAR